MIKFAAFIVMIKTSSDLIPALEPIRFLENIG